MDIEGLHGDPDRRLFTHDSIVGNGDGGRTNPRKKKVCAAEVNKKYYSPNHGGMKQLVHVIVFDVGRGCFFGGTLV